MSLDPEHEHQMQRGNTYRMYKDGYTAKEIADIFGHPEEAMQALIDEAKEVEKFKAERKRKQEEKRLRREQRKKQ